ncbi:MAG: hypothetical protein HQ557_13395 [Bacteroidetes bacterium]|nr:hypothetical protein [Bacteroidota bacterium]
MKWFPSSSAASLIPLAIKVAALKMNMHNLGTVQVYEESKQEKKDGAFFIMRVSDKDWLVVISKKEEIWGFEGEKSIDGQRQYKVCPLSVANYKTLALLFPWVNPTTAGRSQTTFGVGDRLGIAGDGHIAVFKKHPVVPVLAQQSMRELDLTGRSYSDVIAAAGWAVFRKGYAKPWVADGDHLKHAVDIRNAVDQGCTMITADLSDHLFMGTGEMHPKAKKIAYNNLDTSYRERVEEAYTSRIMLKSGIALEYSRDTLVDIVLTYKKAIEFAGELYQAAVYQGNDLDFEISIDETSLPTSPEAHYFVARELAAAEVEFTSLAPRFVGEFQKGIDYIGNPAEFADDFSKHAAIAGELGYKISVHSSSDKFSVYPAIGKLARGAYHVKTSGTNWLIALEVIARMNPGLFRVLFKFSYSVFQTAVKYYHVTPDMGIATNIDTLISGNLITVFDNPTDRQVMHIAYGEMFKDAELKTQIFKVLQEHISLYWERLEKHIGRHLELLAD